MHKSAFYNLQTPSLKVYFHGGFQLILWTKCLNWTHKGRVSILRWNFDKSNYFKHSFVNATKKCFLLVLIFNLQNKKSKHDDNDPDNKVKAPLTLS